MNCEKAESNMVKKPKNRNILVAPNRNHAKAKKIKLSISNDNKNKKYKFDKKKSLITNIKDFIYTYYKKYFKFYISITFLDYS